VKTLPRPETEESVLALRLDDVAAGKAMAAALGSFAGVSAAAHLPAALATRIGETAGADGAVTAFRLEGFAPSIAHRRKLLQDLLAPLASLATLAGAASAALWQSVRDCTPFAADGPAAERDVWRISTAPSRGAEVGRTLAEKTGAEVLYDWAGGLLWAALPARDDAHAPTVRGALAAAGGHATLIRAPAAVRAAVEVFEPPSAAVLALTKRVHESFDPKGVLNSGRMWAGI
jgi:glycolate oxidase FAD binding subunit